MSTLAEIEKAAQSLPAAQLERLIADLASYLQRRRVPHPAGSLQEYSGVIRLPDDPLAWQQRERQDWP